MNKSLTISLLILIVLVGAGYLFSKSQKPAVQQPSIFVTNFEECKLAGYPIMESYPEQCKTPDGRNFVQNITVPNPPAPSFAKFDTALTMQVGDSVINFSDGLRVSLKEINDSRCPKDVQCIWAGELSAVLSAQGGSMKSEQEIRLGTMNNKNIISNGYTFSLKSATEETVVINVKNNNQAVTAGKCYVGGCSGQICSDEPDAMSTCEYRQEYACYKTATCERQQIGECGWTKTAKLTSCLNTNTGAELNSQ